MLEVGWSEILVIALVLIIVVGPKELPGMLRTFGRMATRLRSMANEFKGQFDVALREAELDDVRKGIGEVNKLNPTNALRDAINPLRQLGQDIKSDLQKASDISLKPDEPAIAEPEDEIPEPARELQPAEPAVAKAAEPVAARVEAASTVAPPSAAASAASGASSTASASTAASVAQPVVAPTVTEPVKPKAARGRKAAAEDGQAVLAEAVPRKSSKVAEVAAKTVKPAAKKAAPKKVAGAATAAKAAPRKKAAKAGDA